MSYMTHMLHVMRKSLNPFSSIIEVMETKDYQTLEALYSKFVNGIVRRNPEIIVRRVSWRKLRWELSKLYHLNKRESKLFLESFAHSKYSLFLDCNRFGMKLREEVIVVDQDKDLEDEIIPN